MRERKGRMMHGCLQVRKEEPVVIVPHAKLAVWDLRYQRTTSPQMEFGACKILRRQSQSGVLRPHLPAIKGTSDGQRNLFSSTALPQ